MSLRPHQFKAFKTFAETLRNELASLREVIQKGSSAISDKQEAQQETWKEIPRCISDLRVPPHERTHTEANQERRHRQNHRQQAILTWATWFAFIAASVYAWVAHEQLKTMHETYREMQKQTTLIRQQLVGTMGAVMAIDVGIQDDPPSHVTVTWINNGHVTAQQATVSAAIQRVSLPKGDDIGDPVVLPPLKIGAVIPSSQSTVREIPFPLSSKNAASLKQGEIGIEVKENVSYLDGFDPNPVISNFCHVSIYYKWYSFIQDGRMVEGMTPRIIDCSGLQELLRSNAENNRRAFEAKREYDAKKNSKSK